VPMVIMGIDPGTNITGYGVIAVTNNVAKWLDSGIIKTPKDGCLADKLACIFDGLVSVMDSSNPDLVCIEEAFYAKNVHTTLILGHARGAAMVAAAKNGASIAEFSPREIKKAVVGKGGAAKEQVTFMVKTLLAPPRNHDQADAYDALAAALCGFSHAKMPGFSHKGSSRRMNGRALKKRVL